MGCGLSKAHSHPEVLVSHGNARLTVHGRLLIVQRHQGGMAQGPHRRGDGCLPQVREEVDRPLRRAGRGRPARPVLTPAPHADQDRRPRSSSRSSSSASDERRGPEWIGAELGVPARTVSRVLARHGVPRLASLDPITGEVIRASKVTAVRYERERPGELVHMDVKKLGRIPDGGGWKAHGRGMGSTDTADHRGRVRLRPLPGRRPLPAGLLRGPGRREGHHLRGVPRTRHRLLRRPRHHHHRAS